MPRKNTFAVIGLGRFGKAVCQELVNLDVDVLAIDVNEEVIKSVSHLVSHAMICDTTDEEALKNIGIQNIDHVIVAIGDNIQNSILTTLLLNELGVKEITVKAQNEYHEKVLKKIGADHIIHPEKEMGRRVAKRISSSNISEYFELSDEYSIIEVKATGKVVGRSLSDLDLRSRYGVNIVALNRSEVLIVPDPNESIMSTDELIVVGENKAIEKFQKNMLNQ
ncbi:potassium channel family protein [Haloplasma contractile]|uniref:Potassium uptake protein KtrA n=1 Tax=Haloplasma contractile SSD-17B TaxID=1033810 RepID=F7Q1I4_9MOLU|nr:TrkA family potassium uptake protein [Haloplasma contractile]ERJ12911.1 Potassium uptake protein KtrA [Haloplasma contractile SSD-17B]